jgi:hypothetical protein
MTKLSHAAQAVLNAANGAQCYGPDDILNDSRWVAAAALRAAADQVVPIRLEVYRDEAERIDEDVRSDIRMEFLAIADELEGK